jgi:glycosyltransferase involved in cell wall biosynthesis
MRVLYFSKDYTPHDQRFLTSMSEEGYKVYFLQLESSGKSLEDSKLPKGVEKVEWAGGKAEYRAWDLLKYTKSFKEVVEEIRPDVVHAGPIQTAGLIAALSGFHPLVTMSWAYDLLFDAKKNTFNRWATKYTLKHSDYMAVDCETIVKLSVQFGFDDDRIVKFPWGVDLQKFSPGRNMELRKSLGWDDKIVLLHLRSWEPIYGVDVLVKGFIEAVKQKPKLRLLMLGGGSQENEIKKLLVDSGLAENVKFVGQVNNEELPGYYKAVDLYLSASHSDGSSVSLMEAMASGLPVLVSDIPGNLEWVQDGKQGWLFEDGSSDSLAEKVLEVIGEVDKLEIIGANARRTAEERANWPENFSKLTALYERAVQESK